MGGRLAAHVMGLRTYKNLTAGLRPTFSLQKKGSTVLFSLITISLVKKSVLCEKREIRFFGRKNSRLQLNFHWGEALPCCFVRCISPNEWHFKEVCKILAPYFFQLKKFYFLSRSFQIERKEGKKDRPFHKGLLIYSAFKNFLSHSKWDSFLQTSFSSDI